MRGMWRNELIYWKWPPKNIPGQQKRVAFRKSQISAKSLHLTVGYIPLAGHMGLIKTILPAGSKVFLCGGYDGGYCDYGCYINNSGFTDACSVLGKSYCSSSLPSFQFFTWAYPAQCTWGGKSSCSIYSLNMKTSLAALFLWLITISFRHFLLRILLWNLKHRCHIGSNVLV